MLIVLNKLQEFPGDPVLPLQGAQVQSLVRELSPTSQEDWPKRSPRFGVIGYAAITT